MASAMTRRPARAHVHATIAALIAALTPATAAHAEFQVIAAAGDATPEGEGAFDGFEPPALNDNGQAAFSADVVPSGGGDDSEGIYLGGASSLENIVRGGHPTPSGDGVFDEFSNPTLNGSGQVAFSAELSGTSGEGDEGLYRGGSDSVVQLARAGQPGPDGEGVFANDFGDEPPLNDAGQAAVIVDQIVDIDGTEEETIFRGDGGSATTIARRGGELDNVNQPAINDAGQVAFDATTSAAVGDNVLLRDDGAVRTQIVRQDDPTPSGDGDFQGFGDPALNDAGELAFVASLTNTSDDSSNDGGVFRSDGASHAEIAREGDPAPGGDGELRFFSAPAINESGQTAFQASLRGASGPDLNEALFLGSGGPLTEIARLGQTAPEGAGEIVDLGDPALNDAGQVAFEAGLTPAGGGPGDDQAILLFDESAGLSEVVREGDSLAGDTVSALDFSAGAGSIGEELSGLNNSGQVAFQFELDDGREGIALTASELPADYNGDGAINAADYTLWRDTLGATSGLRADGDGSGAIDAADYELWSDSYGASGATIAPSAAPEPAAAAMGLAALTAALAARRRTTQV